MNIFNGTTGSNEQNMCNSVRALRHQPDEALQRFHVTEGQISLLTNANTPHPEQQQQGLRAMA